MDPSPPRKQLWFVPYIDESKPWRSRSLLPVKPEGTYLALRDGQDKVAEFDQNEAETFQNEVRARGDDLDLSAAVPAYDRWFPAILLGEPRESSGSSKLRPELAKAAFFTLLLGWLFHSPPPQLPLHGGQMKMFVLLGLMIFGVMPLCSELIQWWDNWRDRSPDRNKRRFVEGVLFDRWLHSFPSLVIKTTLILLGGVYLIQVFGGDKAFRLADVIGMLFTGGDNLWSSVMDAALVKSRVMAGEWWRLITAGVMHGSILHLYFNGSALYYLGRVTIAMVGTAMLGLVFFASILGGSVASLYLSGGRPSVGASGGVMGLLGFLMAILVLHKASIPRRYKILIMQATFMMVIFGALGSQFIDNAAHGGGFLVGLLLGIFLVPRSDRVWEFRAPKILQGLGWACWALLGLACFQVTQLILDWNLF